MNKIVVLATILSLGIALGRSGNQKENDYGSTQEYAQVNPIKALNTSITSKSLTMRQSNSSTPVRGDSAATSTGGGWPKNNPGKRASK